MVDLRKWDDADIQKPAGYDQYCGEDRVALTEIRSSAGGHHAALGCSQAFNDIRVSTDLDTRAERWTKLEFIDEYTDQESWFAEFAWWGEQLIVLGRKRFQIKGRPQKTFVLRYDAHGHLLHATTLVLPDMRRPPGGYLAHTGDGGLYVFCGGGAWEVTADDVRVVEHLPQHVLGFFCANRPYAIGAQELCCMVERGDADGEPLSTFYKLAALHLLDMQTGEIRARRLDDLSIPHRTDPAILPIAEDWVLFDMSGDGVKRKHVAVLWNTRSDAFYSIPLGSFGREVPAFFHAASLGRLFATAPGTTWRCLPRDEFLAAVQSDPDLQLHMPPWETAS